MTDSGMLIREKTEYVRLEDGRWQASFPGKQWNLSVTARTLEQARWGLLDAFDDRLFAILCEDLGLPNIERGAGRMQALMRLQEKQFDGPSER